METRGGTMPEAGPSRGEEKQDAATSGTKGAVLRAVAAVAALVVWLGIMGIGGPTFGKISEVQTTDQTSFLPASAEATRAVEWQQRFSDADVIPAVVVAENPAGIDARQGAALAQAVRDAGVAAGDIVGPLPSENARAVELIVPLAAGDDVDERTESLRELLSDQVDAGTLGEGAAVYVTGAAGFTTDLKAAFGGIDGLLLGVAVGAVLLILLVVYRSLLLPLWVLLTAVAALCAAILVVYAMAKAGWIRIDGQSQGILSILVIGAATDYCLLIVARFREAIARGEGRAQAVAHAWRRSVEPIAASAGTVVVGLLCLMFSDLNSNKALGPIAASGIVFSVLAALTLLPALLFATGRAAFWPVMPRPAADGDDAAASHRLWSRIAVWVRAHHRPVWIVTLLVLAAGCVGVTQLKADGVPEFSFVLGQNDAKAGQEAIARHYDAGSGSPTQVYASEAKQEQVLGAVKEQAGVASAYLTGEDGGPARPGNPAKVVDSRVQISVTLSDVPDSKAAEATVVALREDVRAADAEAIVGGPTATALDKQETAQADVKKIIPIVLAAIFLILVLLLRSLVAPLVLVATTVLSYGTAMGVSAWVFNGVFDFPGADPSVPLFGFTFLVALGVDYNIFLMSRVREEALRHGPLDGMSRGLTATGGVITSAGVVLAATFAALGVIPIMFLVQLGFIVAFGVLLDTLVVRTLLVPALGFEMGRWLWWPSKLSAKGVRSVTGGRSDQRE